MTKENLKHESPKYYYWKGDDLYIALYIQARAKHNKIVGIHGDRLKIQITAPPIEGKANNEIIKFFAGFFAIPKTQIKLVSGLQGRKKLLQVMSPNREIELLL